MPHRVGFLYEKMVSLDNCIQAERLIGKHKPDNKMAKHIAAHAEKYGKALFEKLSAGTYEFHESHDAYITDSYKGKTRHLKIPCLEDQAAQQAWLIIATPYIERRNYYYNCGSIPKAGQSRACNALKRWMKKKPKYGAITDIKKFYDNIPHWVVKRGLERIFKDKRFIDFAMQIMASMSSNGVGLAIGHPTSHWFANVALMEIDHELRRLFPDVRFVRYMDDMGFTTNNKRHLWKAVKYLKDRLAGFRLKLKRNFSVFRIKGRGLQFLSYRFFYGYTVLAKKLMFRIARKMKRAAARLTLHMAQGVISYIGILKHCDSYHFRQAHVYPYVNPKKCRRLISNASKNNVCHQAG